MEAATQNNDLKNSREQVMSNLSSIRVGKTKLLKMLSNLKQLEDTGEEVDKTTIARLVEAYDALNKQEEDYIKVVRGIIQQRVVEYANESKKDTNEKAADDEVNAPDEDFIKEVDEVEKSAIAASQKHDELLSTIKERLEKKKLLDQIHQIEQPQANTQSELLEQLEMTKLKLANEKESIDRTEEIRNRLKREAIKRGYIGNNAPATEESKVPEIDPNERVPLPLVDEQLPTQLSNESKEEVHAKIQRHIDQIKARKQRMHECYAQAQEMMSLKKAYDDALKRTRELESMQQHLQEMKVEDEQKKSSNDQA